MAYLVGDTKLIPQSSATADLSVDLSGLDVEVDDYVMIGVMCNATSGTLSETAAGSTTWDTTGKLNLTNASRMWLTWGKVASGPTISDPTFHLSTGTGIWQGFIQIWRDADATTFANGLATASTNTAATLTSGTLTPSADNCSIVYFSGGHDSNANPAIVMKQDEVVCELIKNTDVSNYMAMAVGTVQQGSAASTVKTLYASVAMRMLIITLAINNKTNGKLTRDSRPSLTRVNWFGKLGTTHEAVTWAQLSTMATWTGGTIDGITVNATIGTVATSVAVPPLWNEDTSIPFSANVSSEWVGAWATITSVNMTGKLFSIEWNLPALGSPIGAEGVIVAFADGSGNAAVFRLAKKFSIEAGKRYTAFIDVENATPLDTEGTINWAAVTKFGIGYHRAGSSVATRNINFRNAFLHGTTDLVRGSVGAPQSIEFLDKVLNGWGYYGLCERLPNSKAVLVKTDVRFGDGTTETYLDATASMVAFPDDYSIETQPHWQVGANRIGLTLKGGASDTLNQVASSITGASQQNFTVDCHAAASVSLAGTSIIGSLVTLDSDIPVASATISGCGEVVGVAADLTDVTISATTSTDAAHSVTADGAVLLRTSIDGTGAAYALELGTSVTAITLTDCTLTAGSTDKVHVLKTLTNVAAGAFVVGAHYRINTVGTTDFTAIGASANTIGVNFTATGVGTGTGTADQAVKITISGSTSLAEADATTAGAPVWVAAPALYQVVVVSGFTAGSRIQIYDTTNAEELFNGTASAGNTVVSGTTATWTDPLAASATRAIRVRVAYVNGATAKTFVESTGLTCGITEGTESITYPISQVDDETYNNNAIDGPAIYATSGITFTDAATDLVNISIAGGAVTWPTIYACFVYWIFTASGIDDDVAYIDAPDTANYLLTSMKLKNTHTNPLTVTSGFGRSATTGLVADIIDTAGSTGNIFPTPDHVVAYATGSGALTAGDITNIWSAATRTITTTIPTASDVATQVLTSAQSTPIYADARKMNGATITGTGVDSDLWRGA